MTKTVRSLNKSDEIDEKSSDKICINAIKPIAKKHDRARALRDAFLTSTTDEELEAIFKVWAKPEVIDLIQKQYCSSNQW